MLNNDSNENIFDSTYSPTKCFKYFSQDDFSKDEQSHLLDIDYEIDLKSQINYNNLSECVGKDFYDIENGSDILEKKSGIDFEQIDLMVNLNQNKVKEMYFQSLFEEIIKYLNLSFPNVSM